MEVKSMDKLLLCLMLVLWVIVPVARGARHLQQWSTVQRPAPGTPRVFGSYTAGCLRGAVPLPAEGPGFQSMYRARNRFFGHPMLVRFVQELGNVVATQGWGVLNIGDLAQARGGPTPYGHRSHQTGLDVDIWFWLADHPGALTGTERETLQAPSMLTPGRRALDPGRWSTRHVHLLQTAAEFPVVERIFVHPRIKQTLCEQAPGAAWLRKIRPWWGHDDHFHVRLRCTAGEADCISQAPLPEGTGCDASLTWWLSAAAQRPPARGGLPQVQLPQACWELLKQD
jgi:penicillin-insensitive murein DD-endopeptidase